MGFAERATLHNAAFCEVPPSHFAKATFCGRHRFAPFGFTKNGVMQSGTLRHGCGLASERPTPACACSPCARWPALRLACHCRFSCGCAVAFLRAPRECVSAPPARPRPGRFAAVASAGCPSAPPEGGLPTHPRTSIPFLSCARRYAPGT